jgi:hypothetical protein
MKVYVVLEITKYTDYNYCGVYGTQEKAEQRINEIVKEFGTDRYSLYIEDVEI